MRPTLTEEFLRSGGRAAVNILSQSHSGALPLAKHATMPEPKSSVELK